jgi:NAD(P)H-hydrate epimerase
MGLPIRAITAAAQVDAARTQWASVDLIVDAVLGTGFQAERGLHGHAAGVIEAINAVCASEHGPYVLAIDVPSGLDCDTGKANPTAVRADATATFVARKIGFDQPGAADYLGQVFVAGIGIPPAVIEHVQKQRK